MSQLPTDDPMPPAQPPAPKEPGLDAAQQSLSDALRVSFFVLKMLMVVLFLVYLVSGTVRVDEQHIAVRYQLGERVGTYGPGWHFGLPYPIEEIILVPSNTQSLRIDKSFWYDNPEDKEPEQLANQQLDPLKDSFLITGDTNVVHVQFNVEYVIDSDQVDDYLRNVGSLARANDLVRTAAERGMIHYIATQTVDSIVIRGEFIRETIRDHIQEVLTGLESGITVQAVLIDTQSMPNQVREAYNAVTQAQAERVRAIQEARREYEQILGQAAGGAHQELLLMIRAYESALGRQEEQLAEALRSELDESIAALRLPQIALLNSVDAYQDAVTAAAGSEDPSLLEQAEARSAELLQALASQGEDAPRGDEISGDISALIRTAVSNRSQIASNAESAYERYISAFDAYQVAPLVLVNERLQDTRQFVMGGDLTLNLIGHYTRILTTPDPEDVEAINSAQFEERRRRAAEEAEE